MSKPRTNEQSYLKNKQYHNSDKLSARIRLHQEYSTGKGDLWHWYFDKILEESPQTAKVLEVGTGRGDMWKNNADRVPDGWDITLTDFSAGMVEDNKKLLGDLSQRMTYDVVDVQELPFEDDSFDIVFANYMLYHVPDIPKGIAELRRVLKPDGVLFAATNGEQHMKKIYVIAGEIDEIQEWKTFFSKTFSLQNGTARLYQQFLDIHMIGFKNDLWVTEAQPIIDYIRSMISIEGEKIVEQREAQMRAELEQEIAEKGGILIKKETGMFIARDTR
jgi:ubiquinone/menaquinone biosynthesis C-methylase UbiE